MISCACYMSIMGRLEVGSCLAITLEGGSWSRHSLKPWPLRVLCGSICSFGGGQGLLSAVSWCSVRPSISEDVSLMNRWREKYASTDSSVSCHPSPQFHGYKCTIQLCLQLCRHHHDPTLEHFQYPPQSPSDWCFVSCIFPCQPFKFLSQSCFVEFLVEGKYQRKLEKAWLFNISYESYFVTVLKLWKEYTFIKSQHKEVWNETLLSSIFKPLDLRKQSLE